MVAAFVAHCDRNPLAGGSVALSPGELLGHVKPEQRTIAHLARELSIDPAEVASLFQGLAGELTKVDNELAAEWFTEEIVNGPGQRISIANKIAWLFRTAPPDQDPFLCDVECLPWNLGLPVCAELPDRTPPSSSLDCVGFRVPASCVTNARQPTVFDAGYEAVLHYWSPGGKTVPHPHRPADCSGAFDEIVAKAPMLREVSPEFVRSRAKFHDGRKSEKQTKHDNPGGYRRSRRWSGGYEGLLQIGRAVGDPLRWENTK